MRPRRVAAEGCAGWHVAKDGALGGDTGTISYDEVIGNADVTRENDVIADPSAAGDSNPGHDQTTLADPDVVSDLYQVVHLSAEANDRVIDAASIDAGVGPHLNFVLQDAAAHVRNPAVLPAV